MTRMCALCYGVVCMLLFFFFNDTATTEIYTLSLHDALPISLVPGAALLRRRGEEGWSMGITSSAISLRRGVGDPAGDRKSTRLNSSHANISYAVFCLKKKNSNIHSSPRTMTITYTDETTSKT